MLPSRVLPRLASARVAAPAPATARRLVAVTRVRRLVPAVNLGQLNVFEDGAVVDAAALTEKGIIRDCKYGLKVLSNGNLTKKLTVKAAAFSGSAKTKIEEAGGKAEVV